MNAAIAAQRLRNHRITGAGCRRPEDVVAWLGAVQAQEYPFARWALALRMAKAATDAHISRAIDDGRILRTHVMRPTWHFVTPADIRWMLELTAPRAHRAMAYYKRDAGLDAALCTRATRVFERALQRGVHLTRAELGAHLAGAGIAARGTALALLTMHAELERVICSGRRRGEQLTYALLAERAPRAARMSRDESLAELTRRYFRSHGPATIRDFVWWSGLIAADARRGLDINRARQQAIDGRIYWTLGRSAADAARNGRVHLLPIYDEYLVAYRDRDAVPHATTTIRSGVAGTTTFQHALVVGGQVAGTWRSVRNASEIDVVPLKRLTEPERRGLAEAMERYSRFRSDSLVER